MSKKAISGSIITGSDAEGAGEMFRVTTLPPVNPPLTEDGEVDYSEDFFGKETNLTVSGQLEAEIGALSLGKVYTFGPTFRAENSNTTRHLAEFWMIEP
ncbi:MAG: amino acid--tRNA ligase-related protein, partial [Bacteroidota bacterium]